MEKKKRKPAAAKTKASKAAEKYIFVDFPQENDVITSGEYSIRLAAAKEFVPEISINGSGWSKCRPGAGYWWFDWIDYPKGTHKIEARICNKKGKSVKTASRVCTCKS